MAEKLCLKWNDFQQNINTAFGSLREDTEFGAWIQRLDYGNRHSEFGWEICDTSLGRGEAGIVALRPLQWQNYVDHVAAVTQSKITADGLRNTRKLF